MALSLQKLPFIFLLLGFIKPCLGSSGEWHVCMSSVFEHFIVEQWTDILFFKNSTRDWSQGLAHARQHSTSQLSSSALFFHGLLWDKVFLSCSGWPLTYSMAQGYLDSVSFYPSLRLPGPALKPYLDGNFPMAIAFSCLFSLSLDGVDSIWQPILGSEEVLPAQFCIWETIRCP